MKITAIILAGGKSSRMGKDKGLLLLNETPLIEHVINSLKLITNQIIIVSNNKEYEQYNYPVYKDIIPEKGPVGGIYTGLKYSETETNIVVSCDTPFVTTEFFNYLLKISENKLITIPKQKEKTHPLIGIYSKKSTQFFKKATENNKLKLGLVLKELECNVVDVSLEKENIFSEKLFLNINTKEDFEKIKTYDN